MRKMWAKLSGCGCKSVYKDHYGLETAVAVFLPAAGKANESWDAAEKQAKCE